MKILALVLGFLVAMPAWAEESQQQPLGPAVEFDWQIAKLYVKRRGKTYFRGRGLYMTESNGPAIGFTCQKKQIYAFVKQLVLRHPKAQGIPKSANCIP